METGRGGGSRKPYSYRACACRRAPSTSGHLRHQLPVTGNDEGRIVERRTKGEAERIRRPAKILFFGLCCRPVVPSGSPWIKGRPTCKQVMLRCFRVLCCCCKDMKLCLTPSSSSSYSRAPPLAPLPHAPFRSARWRAEASQRLARHLIESIAMGGAGGVTWKWHLTCSAAFMPMHSCMHTQK